MLWLEKSPHFIIDLSLCSVTSYHILCHHPIMGFVFLKNLRFTHVYFKTNRHNAYVHTNTNCFLQVWLTFLYTSPWHMTLKDQSKVCILVSSNKRRQVSLSCSWNTSLKLVPLHTLFFSLVCSSLKNLYVENDLTCHFVLLVKLLASKWVFYIVMPCGIKTMTCASSNFNGKLWGSPSMCPIMWEAFHVSFFQSRHLDQLLSAHNPFGLLPAPSNIRHNEALSL